MPRANEDDDGELDEDGVLKNDLFTRISWVWHALSMLTYTPTPPETLPRPWPRLPLTCSLPFPPPPYLLWSGRLCVLLPIPVPTS